MTVVESLNSRFSKLSDIGTPSDLITEQSNGRLAPLSGGLLLGPYCSKINCWVSFYWWIRMMAAQEDAISSRKVPFEPIFRPPLWTPFIRIYFVKFALLRGIKLIEKSNCASAKIFWHGGYSYWCFKLERKKCFTSWQSKLLKRNL